jgi:hypothetical protein
MITEKQRKILETQRRHPEAGVCEVARLAGASPSYASSFLRQRGKTLAPGRPGAPRKKQRFDSARWGPWLGILNDEEIARLSGCCVTEVRRRRVAAGWPPALCRRRYGMPMRSLLLELRALYPQATQRALAYAASFALGREVSEASASVYLRGADREVHRG